MQMNIQLRQELSQILPRVKSLFMSHDLFPFPWKPTSSVTEAPIWCDKERGFIFPDIVFEDSSDEYF